MWVQPSRGHGGGLVVPIVVLHPIIRRVFLPDQPLVLVGCLLKQILRVRETPAELRRTNSSSRTKNAEASEIETDLFVGTDVADTECGTVTILPVGRVRHLG